MVRLLTVSIAGALLLVASTNSHGAIYCPWADAIVKLDFDVAKGTVQLQYGLYERQLVLSVSQRPDPQFQWQTSYFADTSPDYLYEFYFGPMLSQLYNVRTEIASGSRFEQRAYCMSDGEPAESKR